MGSELPGGLAWHIDLKLSAKKSTHCDMGGKAAVQIPCDAPCLVESVALEGLPPKSRRSKLSGPCLSPSFHQL